MNDISAIPSQITERYDIERPLGQGGFATVYLALDKVLKRQVAIKIYRPEDDKDAATMAREAEILGQLQHDNIVRVYDAKVVEEAGKPSVPYLVMEYLAGGSLREKLRPHAPPMRPQDALGLVSVLADALHAAHEQGILHLDIKPENIIFDRQGRPFLTDFGIGRQMGGDEETKQTRAMGTNNYASPEQRQGGKLSRASDIYSLGVVLFELLTNQIPLGPAAANPQPPYSPPFPMGHPLTAAKDLVRLVCKALAVAPSYRFESASSFAQQVRDYIHHSSGDTGRLLAASNPRQFSAPSIAQVQIREPERELRTSDRQRVPKSGREMTHDLPPVLPNTRVGSMIYSHQGLEIGTGSVIDQGAFARGYIRIRQDAIVKGDVISLTLIDVSQGMQATNLLAPEVMVRGPIRLAGSIFCRRLRPVQGESENAIHLPETSELGGSLIFSQDFERIIPDAEMGRPLVESRPPIDVFHRPLVRIGSQCTLVAILGDVDVVVDPRQKQLNTIRVKGNVLLGRNNTVRRIEGQDVHIGSGCVVDEVHAEGKLVIGVGSRVGYIHACKGIELGNQVVISSPILFSNDGTIVEKAEAKWARSEEMFDLTARHIFHDQRRGKLGSLATSLLDHRLYHLYERVASGWLPSLSPVAFEGEGDRVRIVGQAAAAPSKADGSFSSFPMDLTPAHAAPASDPTEADEPAPAPAATSAPKPAPAPAAPAVPAAGPTRLLGGDEAKKAAASVRGRLTGGGDEGKKPAGSLRSRLAGRGDEAKQPAAPAAGPTRLLGGDETNPPAESPDKDAPAKPPAGATARDMLRAVANKTRQFRPGEGKRRG